MKHEVVITYEWWDENINEVKEEHREALKEVGLEKIGEMLVEEYTSGELHSSLCTAGEYDVEYSGWWSLTTVNEG